MHLLYWSVVGAPEWLTPTSRKLCSSFLWFLLNLIVVFYEQCFPNFSLPVPVGLKSCLILLWRLLQAHLGFVLTSNGLLVLVLLPWANHAPRSLMCCHYRASFSLSPSLTLCLCLSLASSLSPQSPPPLPSPSQPVPSTCLIYTLEFASV